MEIKIFDLDHKGNGIGKIDNKIVFVPKSIPGDICDISITKTYKKYNIGKINKIITQSEKRIKTLCPYYLTCGGCNISNLNYQEQLIFKTSKIKNIFKKYLSLDIEPTIIPSKKKYQYRNKITYHYDNKIGLISLDNNIIDIDNCLLVSDKINDLYNEIKQKNLSKVKMVTIRECDNGLILSIIGNMQIDKLKEKCLAIYINNKCQYQKEDAYIKLNDIKYLISNNSFFQINTSNIINLYDEIIECGNFTKEDKIIDLYCGVGSISLYIAKYVKSVLGIEIVKDAIEDAKKNATLNNISNVKFLCGDVASLIDDNLNGDVLIVDPPRNGLDKHSVEVIKHKNIPKIIYVSCDPMTLVRDIKLLDSYQIVSISIVDMFPQTHHVECVCLLTLKK